MFEHIKRTEGGTEYQVQPPEAKSTRLSQLQKSIAMPAHSFAFFLLGLVAAAETGLLGYLVHKFEDDGYPSGRGTNGSPTQMRILYVSS
jgi:hypothetical protein